jgi:hypothetical protein
LAKRIVNRTEDEVCPFRNTIQKKHNIIAADKCKHIFVPDNFSKFVPQLGHFLNVNNGFVTFMGVQGQYCVELPKKLHGQDPKCTVPKASCAKLLGRSPLYGENYMTPFLRCDPDEMVCIPL